MLRELYIKNVAIIKEQRLSFDRGFTVLTGETGAGKSIIIESVGLICGARASKESIRSGEEKASVTALFSDIPSRTASALSDMGFDCDGGELALSREVTAGGGSARIGGKPVSVSQLRDVAMLLVNIHGQHASQALLCEENHLGYLDAFSDVEKELSEYSGLYKTATELKSKLVSLTHDEREKQRRIEMLKFQSDEIASAKIKVGEEDELEALKIKIRNAEKINKYSKLIIKALYRSEKTIPAADLASKAADAIGELSDIIPKAQEYIEYLTDFSYRCEDIAETVRKECDTGVKNPDEALDRIEERLDIIRRMKRKYGASAEEILQFRENVEKELSEIESSDERAEEIKDELTKIRRKMSALASAISEKRRAAARLLNEKMVSELAYLEMAKVRFDAEITQSQIYLPTGTDNVRFLISANAGEPLAPLSKIASGGELSRTMLALKCALADKEMTPTLIFDEVDTGISGKTSYKIGKKLRDCSKTAQVICVTHSPQIASQADMHIKISKREEDGRTVTSSVVLDRDGRINELARIIGGEKITDKTLIAAAEMIDSTENGA